MNIVAFVLLSLFIIYFTQKITITLSIYQKKAFKLIFQKLMISFSRDLPDDII
jgi:hypothetical protein